MEVVVARSVLIYVADKARSAKEFHRVLRPGGRVSLFERRPGSKSDRSTSARDLSWRLIGARPAPPTGVMTPTALLTRPVLPACPSAEHRKIEHELSWSRARREAARPR
jgi:SAM-dependent methyltransferase